MAAAKEGSSSDRIEERLLAFKWLTSMCCAAIAVLMLLPVYAERVAEPADASAGTGCWAVQQYSVNAARPGGGVYGEVMGWLDDAVLPPCCQNLSNQTTLFIPYDESHAQAFRDHDYGGSNATIHHLSFCEEDDDTCANCAGDAFAVEAATCAAGRCESRRSFTDGSCTCDRAYEDKQGRGGRWACDDVRGCQWRRDFTVGLPGPPEYFTWFAQDKDFASLYALYLLAVAASAFGVAASLLIRRDFRRSEEDAASTPFRAYLLALVAYFVIQLFTNLAVFCSFTAWRCEHHNVKFSRSYDCDCESPNPTVAAVVGGAWEWLDGFMGWCAGDEGSFSENWYFIYDDEETPEGAAHSYALYVSGVWMGILTNIVLELVLVCRVHLLGGVPGGPSPRTLKVLRYAVGCQLLPLAVFIPATYWAQYDLAKNFVRSEEQGDAYAKTISVMGGGLAMIGGLHVAISLYLCYAFLRPLWRADRLGGADPAMRAQMLRVLIATVVAVVSTLVCYINPVLMAPVNPFLLFAIDSIINDLCLAILALTDAAGDAKAARDASGLRVGVAPDSPGLELSDGAVLS